MIAQPRTTSVTAVLALLLGLQLVLPGPAAAVDSVGVYPVRIDLDEGLRGAEYLRTVTVINGAESDFTVRFTAIGEIETWLSVFDPADLDVELEEAVVPPKSEKDFALRVVVPDDAPNGLHRGGIKFQGTTGDTEGSEAGQGASVGIGAVVTVNVTGEQNLSGIIRDAWVSDVEVDRPPARLRMLYENDGNIQATPVINWQIKDASGQMIGEVSHSETLIRPGETAEIVSEWDSTGQPEGEYLAAIRVMLADDVIDEREVGFQILPYGALTRNGVLDGIRLEGDPRPGGLALVAGIFRNTGEIDTNAVFTAEVHHDGQLIEVIESRERVVIVGEQARLESTFEVSKPGDYLVRGKVFYDGRETDTVELEFAAEASREASDAVGMFVPASTEQDSSGASQPITMYLLGGFGAVVVVGALAFYFGRSRGAAPGLNMNQPRLSREDKQT